MAEPTIETRMQKRIIAMTTDQAMLAAMENLLDEPWRLVDTTDLSELGDWHDVLLYKFILLDLDEIDAFDPIDVIRQIRMEFQINIPVFCFGGDEDIREEMRLSRADRFFSRDEMLKMLPVFVEQYQ